MSLDQNALLKSAGIGVGVGVLFGILRNIPFVGIGCCCLGWLFYAALGVAYGYFSEQNNNPIDVGMYALGGAISGAVAGLVWGIMSGIFSGIMTALGILDTASTYRQLRDIGIDVPPELMAQAQAADIGSILLGTVICACVGVLFYAALAAAGGAIYGAIRQNRAQQTPSAV